MDVAIDYTTTAFEKVAAEIDLVIDTVGGETEQRSWAVLKPGGILASTVSQAQAPHPGVTGKYIANHPNGPGLAELAKLV